MKKPIILAIIFLVSILGINTVWGNPISKHLAEQSAKSYLSENFHSLDVHIEKISFDSKTANYKVTVKSASSVDTYFVVTTDMTGDILFDTYNNVLGGYNTYQRINDAYGALVDGVMQQAELPYTLRWCLGNLEIVYPENVTYSTRASISMDTLQLDADYDLNDLGSSIGYLSIAVIDDAVTIERAAEILLDIKTRFDNANVSFFAIGNMSLASQNQNPEQIFFSNILYTDIYEAGLSERLQESVTNSSKKS